MATDQCDYCGATPPVCGCHADAEERLRKIAALCDAAQKPQYKCMAVDIFKKIAAVARGKEN